MGKITVTVQTEKRLKAISDLAEAVKLTARALQESVQVCIDNNTFTNNDPAISIDTAEEVKETIVKEVDDGSNAGCCGRDGA